MVIGEAQGQKEERHAKGTPSVDQRKSDAERRKKQESRGRKRSEAQEREERLRAERKVRSKEEDEAAEPIGEAKLKQEGDRKSKNTKEKGSLRDQREENKKEMITDRDENKRKGNENDDIVTTDAASVTTRASLVFDHPGPLNDGLWKIPSYARILTHEEVMRDVCEQVEDAWE